jgi:NADPH-dependent 2,4-dienoyl-CoA reductase/sulfur reductase-like enzyme/ferredoxin
VSATAYGVLCLLLVARPELGLQLLWGLIVPLLPLVFLAAPGLWRTVCPLAAANQLPRGLGLTRGRALPPWLRRHGYLVALALFLSVVAARKLGLDGSGRLAAALLGALLFAAVVAGALLKGKSGWCGGLCPLRPAQGLYALSPLTTTRASQCRPCVGCTDACPDLAPGTALRDELLSRERWRGRQRALLAGALPGLIVAFHLTPPAAPSAALATAGQLATGCLVGLGAFFLLEALTSWALDRLVALFAVASFNLFYWFNVPVLLGTVETLVERPLPSLVVWLARENLLLLSAVWLAKGWRRGGREERVPAAPGATAAARTTASADGHPGPERRAAARPMRMLSVTLDPHGATTRVRPGTSLADAADALGAPLPGGCGVGACGGDPVVVVEGVERLSPPDEAEQATLQRLGLDGRARLACSARVQGDVVIALEPPGAGAQRARESVPRPARRDVVVVGGGVAGVTAAERARDLAPDARVLLVGAEHEAPYDRMALLDLVRGPALLERLGLRRHGWATDRGIDLRLGTQAVRLDRGRHELLLSTGEALRFDGLILATGSRARLPDVEGFGRPGSFVLRTAADALALHRFVHAQDATAVAVLGGGPLGIEAAVALRALGVVVTLVASGPTLMHRHLDGPAARLLADHLEELGIALRTRAGVVGVDGAGRVERVRYADGATQRVDALVACVGVVPNAQLARDAGLRVGAGIVVDDGMRTSDARIWAAGDVAEHHGRSDGLWAVAEGQARVAAAGATGGEGRYEPGAPALRLKIPEADLVVLGRATGATGDAIVLRDDAAGTYARLALVDGRLVGAVAWGLPGLDRKLRRALQLGVDLRAHRGAVTCGDWSFLDGDAAPAAAPRAA